VKPEESAVLRVDPRLVTKKPDPRVSALIRDSWSKKNPWPLRVDPRLVIKQPDPRVSAPIRDW
jgi:hypothetical protein